MKHAKWCFIKMFHSRRGVISSGADKKEEEEEGKKEEKKGIRDKGTR